jgi:hypothetical protein
MAIVKHKAGTSTPELYIWAETANINYFLKTPLQPAANAGASNKQASVSAHARRQYPGDTTPVNVSASLREFLVDPGARNGTALPGKPFVLVGDYGLPNEERRQFTYQGRFVDLHAFLGAQAKMELRLYSPKGKRYVIEATGALANP